MGGHPSKSAGISSSRVVDCEHVPNPYDRAGVVSRLFFGWVNPLIQTAYKRGQEINGGLLEEDLYDMPKGFEAKDVLATGSDLWKEQLKLPAEERRYGAGVLYPMIKRQIWTSIFLNVFLTASQLMQPMLLKTMLLFCAKAYFCQESLLLTPMRQQCASEEGGAALNYFDNERCRSCEIDWYDGWFLVALMGCNTLMGGFFKSHAFMRLLNAGIKCKSTVTVMIYEKSLRMSAKGRASTDHGTAVNLLANDAEKMLFGMFAFQMLFSAPITIIIAVVLLVMEIGGAAIAGFFTMLVLFGSLGKIMGKMGAIEALKMAQTDKRVKLTNEVLAGINIIKFYTWEDPFMAQINSYRDAELAQLKRKAKYQVGMYGMMTGAPLVVILVSFVVYAWTGGILTVVKVFTTLMLLDILRQPMMMLPMVIVNSVLVKVAIGRFQDFLSKDEVTPQDPEIVPSLQDDEAIVVSNANFAWGFREKTEEEKKAAREAMMAARGGRGGRGGGGRGGGRGRGRGRGRGMMGPPPPTIDEVTTPTLTGIDFSCKQGSLTCVVGKIGSGKSSLLAGLLSEMTISQADDSNPKYGFQLKGRTAYVSQSAWIQNLTLRENVLFGKPYDKEKYDRIISATCLGPDLDILPSGDASEIGEAGNNLSGGQKQRVAIARACYQDADVYLFDDPLSAVDPEVANHIFEHCICGLLKDKTRVLVTHGLHFLPSADYVVCLDDGKIQDQGTHTELANREGAFKDLMDKHGVADKDDQTKSADAARIDAEAQAEAEKEPTPENDQKENRVTEDETRDEGAVEWRVYAAYLKAAGGFPVACIIVLLSGSFQFLAILSEWWMNHFAQNTYNREWGFYLGIYGSVFTTGTVLAVVGRGWMVNMRGLVASRVLHTDLIETVLNASSGFFMANPTGRLLNRFSRDLNQVDAMLPMQFDQIFSMFTMLVGALITTAIISPLYVVCLGPVAYFYYKAYKYYQPAARDSNRLQSVNTSPLVSHFSETLNGVATIRGFGGVEEFVAHNLRCTDFAHRPMYCGQCCRRWMDLRLELVNALSITATTGSIVLMARAFDNPIDPGFAGIAIKSILGNMMYLGWAMMNLSMLEANMNAVERIQEYTDKTMVTQEPARKTGIPPTDWPREGKVELQGISCHYGDPDQLVLKSLSASIGACEKIGVVGRTGAGKSSLMNAIFRLLEAADGGIAIDPDELGGKAIADIGTHELRSKLAIIPQDPVLFSGTLRFNLDPFSSYQKDSEGNQDDSQLWNVLETCQLKESIEGKEGKLDHEVTEHGANFSQGEKQVICLARALLRQPRILVMDEATSSVDWNTDRLIQETVREKFKKSTVLIIAHRLNTIIDTDKVMVLSKGELIQFDTPAALLRDKAGYFAKMVAEYGEAVAGALTAQANKKEAERAEALATRPGDRVAAPAEPPPLETNGVHVEEAEATPQP